MEILIDDITNSAGTGIFDELMAAVNAQIDTQFLNNRITGTDYSNVYLGTMQTVLQQSVQFALQKQLSEAQIAEVVDATNRANIELEDKLLTSNDQRAVLVVEKQLAEQKIVGKAQSSIIKE